MSFLYLIWSNLARNKLRTVLTGLAVAFAIALVSLLRTMPDGLNRVIDDFTSKHRINVHNRAGIVYDLPYAYLERIRSLPGVTAAASWTWFGGLFDEDLGSTFMTQAIEPHALDAIWPDFRIANPALERFRTRRNGALVSVSAMKRHGWDVGQLVTLKSRAFPLELEFEIVGIMHTRAIPIFYMRREYLHQALLAVRGKGLDVCGQIWLRIENPARMHAISAQIDDMFRNSSAETASQSEKSYALQAWGLLKELSTLILLVTGLIAMSVVFIAANSASMSVRERIREIAVFRAVGFRQRQIVFILAAESTLLSTLAGALGALAAFSLVPALRLSGLSDRLGPLARFEVTPAIVAGGIALAAAIGLVAGLVPSWSAARRSVAAALHDQF